MTPVPAPHDYDTDVSHGYDRLAQSMPNLAAALLHLADLSPAARDAIRCAPPTAATLRLVAAGFDLDDVRRFAGTLEVAPQLVLSPVDLVKARGVRFDAWVASTRLLLARPNLARTRIARFLEPCTGGRRTA